MISACSELYQKRFPGKPQVYTSFEVGLVGWASRLLRKGAWDVLNAVVGHRYDSNQWNRFTSSKWNQNLELKLVWLYSHHTVCTRWVVSTRKDHKLRSLRSLERVQSFCRHQRSSGKRARLARKLDLAYQKANGAEKQIWLNSLFVANFGFICLIWLFGCLWWYLWFEMVFKMSPKFPTASVLGNYHDGGSCLRQRR